jgi:hypothetical protein
MKLEPQRQIDRACATVQAAMAIDWWTKPESNTLR